MQQLVDSDESCTDPNRTLHPDASVVSVDSVATLAVQFTVRSTTDASFDVCMMCALLQCPRSTFFLHFFVCLMMKTKKKTLDPSPHARAHTHTQHQWKFAGTQSADLHHFHTFVCFFASFPLLVD